LPRSGALGFLEGKPPPAVFRFIRVPLRHVQSHRTWPMPRLPRGAPRICAGSRPWSAWAPNHGVWMLGSQISSLLTSFITIPNDFWGLGEFVFLVCRLCANSPKMRQTEPHSAKLSSQLRGWSEEQSVQVVPRMDGRRAARSDGDQSPRECWPGGVSRSVVPRAAWVDVPRR
jgi:hypothetical protein